MIRLLTVWCLVFIFPFIAFAQKDPVKFGDIPMEDMEMKTYAPDTSASAVVLLNYGEANVEERNDVLEYTYIINSDFYTSFPSWQLQLAIPVRHSERIEAIHTWVRDNIDPLLREFYALVISKQDEQIVLKKK